MMNADYIQVIKHQSQQYVLLYGYDADWTSRLPTIPRKGEYAANVNWDNDCYRNVKFAHAYKRNYSANDKFVDCGRVGVVSLDVVAPQFASGLALILYRTGEASDGAKESQIDIVVNLLMLRGSIEVRVENKGLEFQANLFSSKVKIWRLEFDYIHERDQILQKYKNIFKINIDSETNKQMYTLRILSSKDSEEND